MTKKEFDAIANEVLGAAKLTLIGKEAEYVLDEDRLSVFKRAAAILHETAPQAILGMMAKHITSLFDYVAEGKRFSKALATEKTVDAVNYLILLYAALAEEGFEG